MRIDADGLANELVTWRCPKCTVANVVVEPQVANHVCVCCGHAPTVSELTGAEQGEPKWSSDERPPWPNVELPVARVSEPAVEGGRGKLTGDDLRAIDAAIGLYRKHNCDKVCPCVGCRDVRARLRAFIEETEE